MNTLWRMLRMFRAYLRVRVRRQHVCCKETSSAVLIEPSIPVQFRRVTAATVGDVAAIRKEAVVQTFQRFLDAGDIGLYAYHQEKVVAHAWCAMQRAEGSRLVNGYMRLRKGEGLVHYCHVDPPLRRRGIYRAMLSAFYPIIHGEGVKRILIDTETDNIAAWKAISRTGVEYLGECTFVSVGKWLLYHGGYRRGESDHRV